MADFRQRYMERLSAEHVVPLPRWHRTVILLLVFGAIGIALLLWLLPWVQTAAGQGEVSARNPNERVQAISALVSGQVQTWHVSEGQRVAEGDPIVTLVDADPALLERLDNQIAAAREKRGAVMLALDTEAANLERQRRLRDQGLKSQRDIETAQVAIQGIRADIATIDAEINRLEVEKARQSLQTKVAPRAGTILRLMSSGSATYVKPGDILASFIPDGVDRAVVLTVSGLDAPLVYPGRSVRLQFEGWPVFQFSGWPDSGVGTFPGVVEFVEPVADAQGRFRVWVTPEEGLRPWPPQAAVRFGSRVRGWILLEEVRLGYELWRQLNNFPPLQRPAGAAE
ncbi:MAG: biotin/lipoyl-binding protein [Cellvibrionales bacterium]|jgi:multidrug efflux pump subunit AcrA (membrane-fusion protein)